MGGLYAIWCYTQGMQHSAPFIGFHIFQVQHLCNREHSLIVLHSAIYGTLYEENSIVQYLIHVFKMTNSQLC